MRITLTFPVPTPTPCSPAPSTDLRRRDVEVRVTGDPSVCTLDELARVRPGDAADGPSRGSGMVTVDGRNWPGATSLTDAGARAGSTIEFGHGILSAVAGDEVAVIALAETGGLDAGRIHRLAAGVHRLGRDHGVDVLLSSTTVSRHHADASVAPNGSVTIIDRRSTNGSRVGAAFVAASTVLEPDIPIALGATQLTVTSLATEPAPRPIPGRVSNVGTTPFNRPPRVGDPPPRPAITTPTPRRQVAGHTPFNWAMVAAPLAIGLLMARLFNPMFAIFALLSPVMVVASWLEQRHRATRSTRRGAGEYRRAVARFAEALERDRAHELLRRRNGAPDLSSLVVRAAEGRPTLWERRQADHDFLVLRLGTATRAWSPLLDRGAHELAPDAQAVLAAGSVLVDAPVVASLGPGSVIGIAGHDDAARAVARALLVQAVVLHGPADVRIAVLPASSRAAMWAFATWLPHSAASGTVGYAWVATDPAEIDEISSQVASTAGAGTGAATRSPFVPAISGPVLLTVVDDLTLLGDHGRLHRVLPAGSADRRAAIILAPTVEQLPACSTTVICCLGPDGAAAVVHPASAERIEDVVLNGVTAGTASGVARSLARFTDPELDAGRQALPDLVTLATLLADPRGDSGSHPRPADELSVEAVLARWARSDGSRWAPARLGLTADGPLMLDLVLDGPHALIGGTTGSGKSELLRTLIVSLAATSSPAHLNLVLIDYKGGSAFDACARLPHTVGLVTDLDERLAGRALLSLEAELRHRETRLREAGTGDLPAYESWRQVQSGPTRPDPIARLVVVIDEFATMATEVPDFLDALVSVAQRGRSLGVHLVLATQRPHGAINENIRTNTNIRIALRVLDPADSTDVIGAPDAAGLPRSIPGRAFVRLGPDELRPFQTAQASNPARTVSLPGLDAVQPPFVLLDPLGRPRPDGATAEPGTEVLAPGAGLTDLDVLVENINAAHLRIGAPRPRRPWLEPLPDHLSLDSITTAATGWDPVIGADHLITLPLGLLDEPACQRQKPWCWSPGQGNLLVYGMPGTGATTTLVTAAASAALAHGPDALHVYAIDAGAQGLRCLLALPHTGAIIALDERARQHRLVRRLREECQERRRRPDRAAPVILLLIDGFGAFRAEHDDLAGLELLERVGRVALDGPAVGIHVALTAQRPQSVPPALAAATSEKLLLRLADSYDYSLCGVRGRPPMAGGPGRGLTPDGLEVQVAQLAVGGPALDAALAAIGARWPAPTSPPAPIVELPATVTRLDCGEAEVGGEVWRFPVGLGDHDLGPRALLLHEGEHALIAGPPRSGRTTALAMLAAQAVRAGASVVLLSPRPDRSIDDRPCPSVVRAPTVGAAMAAVATPRDGPVLVLIDDAELVADTDGLLDLLLTGTDPRLRVIAAGRADRLRSAYGHWTRRLRESGQGLALHPDLDTDGDLWGVRLPRGTRVTSWPVGRGMLVRDGGIEIVQVAT